MRNLGLIVALVIALAPRPAQAQGDFIKDKVTKIVKKVGFHASTSFADPLDTKDAEKNGNWGLSVGLAPGKTNGWRYPVGIAWFTEDLRAPSGEIFAKFRSRPIVGGIGYGWHFGQKFSTGVQLQGGWAFNSLKPQGDASSAFLVPGNPVYLNIGNAPLLRPQVKVEYFLTPKFTLRTSLNYVFIHPRVTVTTPQGVISEHWNASHVSLAVGVGIYPFRK